MRTAPFVLGDVERRGFDIPPVRIREDLGPGDLAELMILSRGSEEPAWAEVTDVLGPGWFSGVLDTGETVEFGPEHVMDVQIPRPMMGAEPERKRPIFERAAEEMMRPRPPRTPGVFEYASPGMEPPPSPPRRSIFDIFRRKKAPPAELTPIPPGERRAPPAERPLIEFFPTPESPFVPAEPPWAAPPEPEMPPPPAIIIPPAPPRGLIVPPEAAVSTPAAFFETLAPAPEPSTPGGVIPAQPPPFEVLAPLPPERKEPEGPKGWLPELPPPFEVLAPAPVEAPREAPPFELLVPPPQERGLAPFEVLPPPMMPPPEGPFEILVPRPAGPFEILVPREEERGIAMPFEILTPGPLAPFAPPPMAPPGPEPVRRRRPRKPKMIGDWKVRTPEEWLDFWRRMERTGEFRPIEELVADVEEDRDSDWFRQAMISAHGTGIDATLPIIVKSHWPDVMEELEIPESAWGPFLDNIQAEEPDAWMDAEDRLFYPINQSLNKFFHMFTKLPGDFGLMEDGGSEGQLWGLGYHEWVDEEEAQRLEEKMEREQVARDEARKRRLKERGWTTPEPKRYAKWIHQNIDLNELFRDIRRERKTADWKKEVRRAEKDYRRPEMLLQKIGERGEGDRFLTQAASFLDIPDNAMNAYFGVRTGKGRIEDLWEEFKNEVLLPAISSYNQAFEGLMPKDLPGEVRLGYDDEELWLYYREELPER